MSNINNLPLCITLGDPLGVGPEITAMTLEFLQKKKINISFIVIGSKRAFHKACNDLNINKKLKYIIEFIEYDENIDFLMIVEPSCHLLLKMRILKKHCFSLGKTRFF